MAHRVKRAELKERFPEILENLMKGESTKIENPDGSHYASITPVDGEEETSPTLGMGSPTKELVSR